MADKDASRTAWSGSEEPTKMSRHHVVATLRRAGLSEAADEAMAALPDPVDVEYMFRWGAERGITRDELISLIGGSP